MAGSAPHSCASLVALASCALATLAHAAGVGDGERAQPALKRVGVAQPGKPGDFAAAVDLGGGFTESLESGDSAHGRAAASAAASVDAARFLQFALLVRGRYDRHSHGDDGFLFQSELAARFSVRFGELDLGIEGTAWVPGGNDVGSSFSALGADGKLLLSGHASSVLLAGFGGYRLDRSRKTIDDPERLSLGDRSALGASDYDALLSGLGIAVPAGPTTLFGEAAAQLLLQSPKLSASPIWLTLGARRPLGSSGLSAELSVSALVSSRPDVGPSAPLSPIEPRVLLQLGLRYRALELPPTTVRAPLPPPRAVEKVAAPPPPPTPASIDLVLLDDRGQPLARAEVTVTQAGTDKRLVETEPGHYRLDEAEPGAAHVRARADGFKVIERDIELVGGKPLRLDAKAEPALPPGQVRGIVRSFRGKPLPAKIQLQPGGLEASTDAEGFFQIDVPPGQYEVLIEAPGYEPQQRKAKVDQQGVVIVNADLVHKK